MTTTLVQELDALGAAIALEQGLRPAVEREIVALDGAFDESGPMRAAHDAEVETCVRLARLVVEKHDAG